MSSVKVTALVELLMVIGITVIMRPWQGFLTTDLYDWATFQLMPYCGTCAIVFLIAEGPRLLSRSMPHANKALHADRSTGLGEKQSGSGCGKVS
jgi:hypothetical protein